MKALFFVAVVLATFTTAVTAGENDNSTDDGGCWRPTYGRGVGKPISTCEDGMDEDVGLCYKPCDDGYYGVGPVCWHSCPEGFTDYGVGCSKPAPYWRSGPFFTKKACDKAHPNRGCERWGLLWYEICSEGYYNSACCICTHYCPGGLIDTGASCTKKTYGRGVGTPLVCAKGLVEDAALCYPECQGNYNGVGPVCWDTCPEGKYGCGALCLESKDECIDEMLSIAEEVGLAVAEIVSDPEDAVAVLAKTVIKLAPQLAKPICPQN